MLGRSTKVDRYNVNSIALWWLRRDFRLLDNPALVDARAAAPTVFAVFCLEELNRLNARQRAFAVGCLEQLRAELGRRDASLSVLGGDEAEALTLACARLGASAVYTARAYASVEQAAVDRVDAALARSGRELVRSRGDCVHEPESVAQQKRESAGGYRVFPPFYEAWRRMDVTAPLAASAPNGRDPTPGPLPDEPEVFDPKPGEAAALMHLGRFLTARAASYAFMGAYPASDGTSKLSSYIRFGCISPRTLCAALQDRMAKSWTLAQERDSMRLFLRRLALRDFFTHLAHFAPELHDAPLQEKMRGFPWSSDARLAEAWSEGKTGYPLIDAAMRQLKTSGYVHQRAARCAASFCCFDLGLDWRIGRDVWMRELLAADDALADGNWQWIAGVGSDQAAYPRIFNPIKQALLIDPQGVYVRRWVRELAKLPTRAALEPWQLSRQQQTELKFYTPEQYPPQIVDHAEVARDMLAKFREFRNRS